MKGLRCWLEQTHSLWDRGEAESKQSQYLVGKSWRKDTTREVAGGSKCTKTECSEQQHSYCLSYYAWRLRVRKCSPHSHDTYHPFSTSDRLFFHRACYQSPSSMFIKSSLILIFSTSSSESYQPWSSPHQWVPSLLREWSMNSFRAQYATALPVWKSVVKI